jgi:hypothetical protein
MRKEIFPSSYECDCGHQSHFFENTIREIKAMSRKKKVRIGDSATDEHFRLLQRRDGRHHLPQ